MANKESYWELVVQDDGEAPGIELSDADREHIAQLIREGYTEGEIVKDWE